MADTVIRTCDGCMKILSSCPQPGEKVVVGCEGQYPPSVIFSYCSACALPDVYELARMRPYWLLQSIEICVQAVASRFGPKPVWDVVWKGGVEYLPKENIFTDGYETIIRKG